MTLLLYPNLSLFLFLQSRCRPLEFFLLTGLEVAEEDDGTELRFKFKCRRRWRRRRRRRWWRRRRRWRRRRGSFNPVFFIGDKFSELLLFLSANESNTTGKITVNTVDIIHGTDTIDTEILLSNGRIYSIKILIHFAEQLRCHQSAVLAHARK